MAKAVYQKGQRVFVKAVGAWAVVERILPQWVRGVEEPLKVLYDVGLGREFQAAELIAEAKDDPAALLESERWRVLRARNKLSADFTAESAARATFPVVVTDDRDWGGWRVPAAEYERDPERIEFQARIIANALRAFNVCRELIAHAEREGGAPEGLESALSTAESVVRSAFDTTPEAAPAR